MKLEFIVSLLEFFKSTIIVGLFLLIFDYIWLKYIFIKPWSNMVRQIQQSPLEPKIRYAILVYILIILAITIYVLPQINNKTLLKDSILYGGLLGLIIYGVFDFTNIIFFEKYSLNLALIDMMWGTFLFTIVTYFTKKYHIKLLKWMKNIYLLYVTSRNYSLYFYKN